MRTTIDEVNLLRLYLIDRLFNAFCRQCNVFLVSGHQSTKKGITVKAVIFPFCRLIIYDHVLGFKTASILGKGIKQRE